MSIPNYPRNFAGPSQGARLGLSPERKAEVRRQNRLKQELYRRQKTIQFSNLLERSGDDLTAYVESQENVFLAIGGASPGLDDSTERPERFDEPERGGDFNDSNDFNDADVRFDDSADNSDASDDANDDLFAPAPYFDADADFVRRRDDDSDRIEFDPAAPTRETLRDRLLEQIRLDDRLDGGPDEESRRTLAELRALCEKIVDNLDDSGVLTFPTRLNAPTAVDNPARARFFDSLFGLTSTPDDRLRASQALDDYFDDDAPTYVRRLARRAFDAVVGRKTTKDERIRARAALDVVFGRASAPAFFDSEALDANDASSRAESDALESLKTAKTTSSSRSTDASGVPALPQSADSSVFPQNAAFADVADALFDRPPTDRERALTARALEIVRSFDPPGVGARDARDSLLLRLKPDAPYRDELKRLLAPDAFDDFLKRRTAALVAKTGLSAETLARVYSAPYPFYPSPGTLFASTPAPRPLVAEIVVEKAPGADRWTTRLDSARERFSLDSQYRRMLLAKSVDSATKDYLRRKYVEARALLDALGNRDATILRVAQAVVDFQFDYLADADASPRPLTQLQIADKLGLDASTVSRACADKLLATPRGPIPFKALFPKAVSGDETQSDVAARVRRIIADEDPSRPLDDASIAARLLERFGVKVSRKTVQEYRERERIPNSRERKRLNAAR